MYFEKIRHLFKPGRGRVWRSIRLRITALFVVIFGTTLIAFSALLYTAFIRNHQAEFDADLYNHALDVSHAINIDVFGNVAVDSEILTSGGKIFPFSAGKAFLQIIGVDGKIIARSRTLGDAKLPFDHEDLLAVAQEGLFFRTINRKRILSTKDGNNLDYRLLTYEVRDRGPIPFILQVAVSLALLDQERHGLLLFFLFGIPLTLVIAGIGGWYLSGSALAPVNAIIEKAKRLRPENLSERLPVPVVDDELRQLSLTLNELLNRLEQAFLSQERFIADASHELKTPLAIMRGELDLVKRPPQNSEEFAKYIVSASQELMHLSRMVEDLLMLARVDAGAGSLSIRRTRLDEILMEVVARLEPRARAKDVKLRLDFNAESFEVNGDTDLLQSMFQNLIENAVKFSPVSSHVEVSLTEDGPDLVVTVRDRGPGIPADLQNKIFERFYRVRARNSETPGFGLGLTIARRVAEAHGATLTLSSNTSESGAYPVGTSFSLRIKKV